MKPRPFTIDVPQAVLDDLQQRLAATRWPDEIPGSDWRYGADLGYIKELVEYWRDGYDWRAQELRLNAHPQFKVELDGEDLHFIHARGRGHARGQGPQPFPLIMVHGWPSSVHEMYKVIGPLSDPQSHGGDAADAFEFVVPSLPGYGFSDPSRQPGMAVARMAERLHRLMTEVVGFERYGAAGGDWGSAVTTRLGYAYPDHVAGIHLSNIVAGRIRGPREERSRAEEAYIEGRTTWGRDEGGYSAIQGTKPQTLGYALNDSPTGLAAWIVEKFRAWSDCDGDVERRFTKDELLTNVMIYWVTQTANSAGRSYYEASHNPPPIPRGGRVPVPTGVAAFAGPLSLPPREAVERGYNVTRWTVMPSGGHFAALEEPAALVEDVRAFFRPLRGGPGQLRWTPLTWRSTRHGSTLW